jgi:signal transduction histidine kinase
MITALDLRDDLTVLEECLKAGADDFLSRGADNLEVVPRVTSKLRAQAWYVRLQEEERRAAVADFAEMVAHDLGNALTVPRLLVEMAADESLLSDDEALRSVYRGQAGAASEGMQLAHLLIQALDGLARMGGERQAERVLVRDLVRDAGCLTQKRARSCGVVVADTGVDGSNDAVMAWRPGILFAIVELVVNAATVMKQDPKRAERQPTGSIALGATRHGSTIRITVADDGPGVPEGLRREVFNRGYTTRRDQGGSGRGLFFVKQRIQRAGGKVWCEPNPGGGTRFIIELPACDEA